MAETDQPRSTVNPHPTWRTSSYCGNQTCVEIATNDHGALMRDNKRSDSPVLDFNRGAWDGFLDGIRAGEFDLQ